MVITVFGWGLADRLIPSTVALSRVVVAEAVPFEEARAVVFAVSAVINPFSRFTSSIAEELFAFALDDVIFPNAVSEMVPVLAIPGTLTPARLTDVSPPVQPISASDQGPLDTEPDPAFTRTYKA